MSVDLPDVMSAAFRVVNFGIHRPYYLAPFVAGYFLLRASGASALVRNLPVMLVTLAFFAVIYVHPVTGSQHCGDSRCVSLWTVVLLGFPIVSGDLAGRVVGLRSSEASQASW